MGGTLISALPESGRVLNTDRVRFRCSGGHIRKLPWRTIRKGHKCVYCFRHRHGEWKLEDYATYAEDRGGTLLTLASGKIRHKDYLSFRCAKGHVWKTMAFCIRRSGTWCRKCHCERSRLPLDEARSLAKERGGELLSTTYRNAHTALRWRCGAGHVFRSTWNCVTRGRWCPKCKQGRGERIVRAYFEALFGEPFPRCRPAWLEGLRGVPLELDGYCQQRAIAFEHQGMHHYRSVKHYGGSTDLPQVRAHDRLKRRLCYERGVALIEVPEIGAGLPLPELRNFIVESCDKAGVPVPLSRRHISINIGGTYCSAEDRKKYDKLKLLVESRGGQLLSTEYVTARTPMRVMCECGHEWESPYYSLLKNWCVKCRNRGSQLRQRNRSRSEFCAGTVFDRAKREADEREVRCLSRTYVSARLPLNWKCKKCGYVWAAPACRILAGCGCRKCGLSRGHEKMRLTIGDMQRVARERDGVCLSRVYRNAFAKLKWRHNTCGTVFFASADSVRNGGTWCPPCGRKAAAAKRRRAK
jgi:hypothetical protein